MSLRHPERQELREAIESLPILGDVATLDERDALAVLHDARQKLPRLDEGLRERTEELVAEVEAELEMSSGDTVEIGDAIIRGMVRRALNAGAAQALFNTGSTLREINMLREEFQLSPFDNS